MAKTKKGTKAAAVAGVVVAAAVAASSVGGPSPSAEGNFSGSMEGLETAVVGLVDKSVERGMSLPQSPGINDVTTGMEGMAPTKGTTRTVQVASGGEIAKGDYIKVCEEVIKLKDKTFATGGVKVVGATSNGKDSVHCADRTDHLAAILYTKGGSTYLRVAKFGDEGNMTFTNTLVIAQGAELECADMGFDHAGEQLVVFYNKDGDGWMSRVHCSAEENHIEVTWSDRWRLGGDPQNICVAYDSFSDLACLCCTVLPDGVQDASKRYAVVEEMYISSDAAVVSPTPCVLTAEAYPCLYGIDYSTVPTAGGWDISYAANWYDDMQARQANGETDAGITEDDKAAFVIHISYPTTKGGGRGLIVVEMDQQAQRHVRNYVETTTPGYSADDTVAIDTGATFSEVGYVAMTDVVHSAYLGEDHYLFVETYGTRKDGAKPVNYFRLRPEEVYEKPIESISCALMNRASALGYTVDRSVYVQILEVQRSGSVFGPAVKVAETAGYAGVVPVSGNETACIYVDQDGAGHVLSLRAIRTVEKEQAARAVGTALEDGKAGENIRADLNYWPDEQW